MSADTTLAQNAVSVETLAAWRESNTPHHLLDVREPHEIAICAIEGAQHIPMGEIPARLADIPSDAPLVVLCHHGARSQRVVDYLRGQGHTHILNLTGGIDAWSARIDAAMARY
jgi:rhodanese-related sulfurtransferase